MRIKVEIPYVHITAYYLKFKTFEELRKKHNNILWWRQRSKERLKRMLAWMEIPYTMIDPFEFEIEDGYLTEKNKRKLLEQTKRDFREFMSKNDTGLVIKAATWRTIVAQREKNRVLYDKNNDSGRTAAE